MYLSKINFDDDYILRKSLLQSKLLFKHVYQLPKLVSINLKLKCFDNNESAKSKLAIVLLDFLERMTSQKTVIKSVRVSMKKGAFVNYQTKISNANFDFFIRFFNTFFLTNPLLNFSSRPMKVSRLTNNKLLLSVYDLDLFFDAYSRRLLPDINIYG